MVAFGTVVALALLLVVRSGTSFVFYPARALLTSRRAQSGSSVVAQKTSSRATLHNLIIIGSGPAGHTCGIYAARANLNPLMIEGDYTQAISAGGLLTTTKIVENFPGFPDGVDGYELTERFKKQSSRFGMTIQSETVVSITKENAGFIVSTTDNEFRARAVIVATGSNPNKLPIAGYDKYQHNGISTCAICDAGLPAFRNKPIAVVGGGDSACEEALYITNTASKVYLIHRRDSFRASKIMQDRVFKNPKIEIIWDTEIEEMHGEKYLENLSLRNTRTGAYSELPVSGLFVAIGHTPNSKLVSNLVECDANGYIVTDRQQRTSVEGVWACGDVQDPHWKQAITAAASGCVAALDAEKWLSERN